MRIALEIVPAHHAIDGGFSRWMYSVTNAILERAGRHEFLVILGAEGNAALIRPNSRTTIVQCTHRNQNVNQQWSAARHAQRWKADVLHNFGAPASLLWTRPLILTIHDAAIATHPELFPRRWTMFQKYAYRALKKRNPLVITVSEFSRDEIASHMGFPKDRIHVVYPIPSYSARTFTDEERAAVRTTYSLPEHYILHVGYIEPRKNLARLIAAFERYRVAGGAASLVIAGRIGWSAADVVALREASPVRAHIHFPGYIADADLPALIAGARTFVYPSLYEGFGAPPVEALSFDVPVVASRAGSLPEALGDAAVFVDPLDPGSISDGLTRVTTDDGLRSVLIAAGRRQRNRYSADATAAGILSVYDRIERERG